MENGAFAPKEQMLHFPLYFQIHGILKASICCFLGGKGLSQIQYYFYMPVKQVNVGQWSSEDMCFFLVSRCCCFDIV